MKRSSGSRSVHGVSRASVCSAPTDTPTKRPRAGYIVKGSPKDEEAANELNDGASTVELAKDLNPEFGGKRTCLGCDRVDINSGCFMKFGEPIEWLYDSPRGSWCRDCHSVWRHVAKATMTLTMYELHVRKSWAHKVSHLQYLVCFNTLKSESAKRITKDEHA
jgi:hypothetical protein